MSNFPNKIDDDTTLPPANDNLTEDRAEVINAARDAIFNIETNIGTGAAGVKGSLTERLGISIQPDGYLVPSVFASLPQLNNIVNAQISSSAGIQESKLLLDHATQDLFNYTTDLSRSVNTALDWISVTGVKLEPHLLGIIYRHTLSQIDVSSSSNLYLKNKFGLLRDNSQSYNLLADINSDFVAHQLSDGTVSGAHPTVITNNGSTYPSSYAHTASGIYLDTSIFSLIPHTAIDLQSFAEFVDSANTLLLGTKIQTLYQNGIPRSARSTRLGNNSKGVQIVPATKATTYLLNSGNSPVDDIQFGDDIISFTPDVTSVAYTGFQFDAQFNAIKPGDIVNVNYGSASTSFLVKEINYNPNVSPRVFILRIAGKNLIETTNASVDVSKTLFNTNKYGVLAPAVAELTDSSSTVISVSGALPSLIIGNPRAAQGLGIGFNPDLLDPLHYNLYLQLYPNGNPNSKVVNLIAIDVTGNTGTTPGSYTLDSIVQNINNTFRRPGFNYRFIAFENQGEFGIMLADSFGGAAFSIVSGIVDGYGNPNSTLSTTVYPQNVIDISNNIDPLGLGPSAANIASPPFSASFISGLASEVATKVLSPLQRNFYFVDGGESDRFALETGQILDGNGDSYWPASITNKLISGPRVQVTYTINENLSTSRLQVGKTLVVQPENDDGFFSDFGRFIIQSVTFNSTCTADGYVYSTDITVYDAIHGSGTSPYLSSPTGTTVRVYFGSDSVGFSSEQASDQDIIGKPFKRSFEIYVEQDGYTFSYERARSNYFGSTFNLPGVLVPFFGSTELKLANIINVSPKLRGYSFSGVTKINLQITSFAPATGSFSGYLRKLASDGVTETNLGPVTTGKQGQVTRFYDETNIDYIDILFDLADTIPSISNKNVDIQLFPSLSQNDEVFLIAKCQVNDATKEIKYLRDHRQFGNVSEKQLSDSAISFIKSGDRYLHQNGVVRGFDLIGTSAGTISLKGGLALVNGKINAVNQESITIPLARETLSSINYNVNWLLCVNETGQFITIPLTDYDSVLVTPTVGDRVVTLINAISLNTYDIDSTSFNNLINVRKDLTPLYLAAATITGSGAGAAISLSVKDIRKYATEATSTIEAVLTDKNTQGNFKSTVAAFTWLKYNSVYQNRLNVKSNYTSSIDPGFTGTSATSPLFVRGDGMGASLHTIAASSMIYTNFNNVDLTFDSTVGANTCNFNNLNLTLGAPSVFTASNCQFNGVNATFTNTANINTGSSFSGPNSAITFAAAYNLSNVTFTNVTVTFSISSSLSNVTFNNCNVIFTAGCTFSGVTFNNCTVHINNSSTVLTTTFNDSTVFFVAGSYSLTGVTIRRCTVTQSVAFPAGSNVSIIDSTVNLPVVKGYELGNNYTFQNTIFNWTVTTDGYYVSSDFINASGGMCHISLGSNSHINSLIVRDCTFNTSSADRYSFFSFQFTNITSYVQNIDIRNNKFMSTASSNDVKAVVAFTSMLAVTPTSQPIAGVIKNPTMFNVSISDNTCNHDQMIAITAARLNLGSGLNSVVGPLLSTINCKINNNTCGTIGFITASNNPYFDSNSDSSPAGLNRNKSDQLTINNNTCRLITNLDSIGQYIAFRLTFPDGGVGTVSRNNLCPLGTGSVLITNNTTNWIQVGSSSNGTYTNGTSSVTMQNYDGVSIIDNTVTPANPTFLSRYTDTVNTIPMGNYGITLRRGFDGTGNGNNIITGNKVIQRPNQNSSGTSTTYLYDHAIVCLDSSTITNNLVNGVLNNSTSAILVLWSTGSYNVNGNIFSRGLVADQTGLSAPTNGNTILTYVWAPNGVGTNLVKITDNIFDSRYVDQANTTENAGQSGAIVGTTIPVPWIFSKNKNQIGYAAIPLNSGAQPATLDSSSSQREAIVINSTGDFVYPTYNNTQVISTGVAGSYDYASTRNLNQYLPPDVTILASKIGINFSGTATRSGTNILFQEAFVYPTLGANFTAGTGSAADPTANAGTLDAFSHTTNTSTLTGTPLFNTIDYSASINAATYSDRFVVLRVLFIYTFSAVTAGATFTLSPIVIKYIW